MSKSKTRVLTDQNGHTLRVIDNEFYALQAERDTLAVTVNKFSSIRKEWGGLVTNDMRTLTAFIELSNETPQANLAAHDAEVAESAINDFCEWMLLSKRYSVAEWCGEYTAQLRAKAKL